MCFIKSHIIIMAIVRNVKNTDLCISIATTLYKNTPKDNNWTVNYTIRTSLCLILFSDRKSQATSTEKRVQKLKHYLRRVIEANKK